ncbi:MAG: hydantoinase/oxoprolinase family protein [Gammaproteobacteria bacterium]|nr:hydantoinase/oxoprolinase family protein [Gammaproteobacteria bacterium]
MTWRIAVDIGGTFTDIVALEEHSGALHLAKVPSTPDDPARGFIQGLDHVTARFAIPESEIGAVFHGTTVATNAILERKYAPMGLIITRGYREALECARQTVPGEFGDITWWIKPPRVVPLEFVREVSARIDVQGREVRPVDPIEVRALALDFKQIGIKAIAVSLLHSYRDPAHEQAIREIIREVYPECFISISSDILREYREYERTNTTCLNTALMPLLSDYHAKLQRHLRDRKINAPFYIMRSSGGLAQAEEIARLPIAAALSGPAAGVVAATHCGMVSGFKDVIAFDVGGTSADICLVENGSPRMLTEGRVDIYDIKTPMIDIHTVGAGGGSIAWLAGGRSLKVGPQSAGAAPGPACYDRGGTEPTVTDANLVLGRITSSLAGGGITLNRDKAVAAIGTLAQQLGLDLISAAEGILRIAIENMAAGIRTVSVKRGRDPRTYALVAFGGAGPLHACTLADRLDMKRVLIPPNPGVTSAYGLLLTDVRIDQVHTNVQREDRLNASQIEDDLRTLETQVTKRLTGEGFSHAGVVLEHFIDMRYAGQAYEIRTPLPGNQDSIGVRLRTAIDHFHHHHKDLYGYSYEGKQFVELVNVGVTGLGLLTRPQVPSMVLAGADPSAAFCGYTTVHFPQEQGTVETPVYDRGKLRAGNEIVGPAIINQYDSTTVLNPGWQGHLDRWGTLVLTKAQPKAQENAHE